MSQEVIFYQNIPRLITLLFYTFQQNLFVFFYTIFNRINYAILIFWNVKMTISSSMLEEKKETKNIQEIEINILIIPPPVFVQFKQLLRAKRDLTL